MLLVQIGTDNTTESQGYSKVLKTQDRFELFDLKDLSKHDPL